MTKQIKIANRSIGLGEPPLIVVEMSGNHNQSLERALQIVEAAAQAGAHALKLQTYTADTLTIDVDNEDFFIRDPNSQWSGQSLYKLYQKAYTPWEWHKPIFDRCRELELIAFSTPFDETAVDFLEDLDVPAYKIASFENNHLPLIRKVAATRKPLMISTGMATIEELEKTVHAARASGCQDLILLKCTSTYPASSQNINLKTIPHLRDHFKAEVGLSDHTLGIGVSIAAVALGATVIEKHLTIERRDGGVDSTFSMEPGEMKMLVEESFKVWQAKGGIFYGVTDQERKSIKFRRSIYAVENIKKGENFSVKNLRVIRPAGGLAPEYYEALLSRKASCDMQKGTPVAWESVE